MNTNSNSLEQLKAAISIKDMAAQCGLSRQRFMQLVKTGVFPMPLIDEATKRPYYSEELQAQCLEVRKRNFGVNGKVIMFYARRTATAPIRKTQMTKPKADHSEIIDGLRALGLVTVTSSQVAEAVGQVFPRGISTTEDGEVIRAIFVYLHRKNSGEKVGSK